MELAKLGYSDITNAPSEFLLMMADLSWSQRLKDGSKEALIDVRNNYGLYLSGALDVVPLRVFLRLGTTMAELNDLEGASSIYRRGCKEWPAQSSVWKGLGLCLMQMAKYVLFSPSFFFFLFLLNIFMFYFQYLSLTHSLTHRFIPA
jgi:hypothetical protein